MDWLDLLAVQGTLKSPLQHHSSKASILRCSAFFTVQFSHPYVTTGKTIALIRRTLVGKEMSLLLNMLSRLVIIFLPRSKRLLISWLQSPSAVILEPPKIKSDTVSTFPHLFPMKWWDQMPNYKYGSNMWQLVRILKPIILHLVSLVLHLRDCDFWAKPHSAHSNPEVFRFVRNEKETLRNLATDQVVYTYPTNAYTNFLFLLIHNFIKWPKAVIPIQSYSCLLKTTYCWVYH